MKALRELTVEQSRRHNLITCHYDAHVPYINSPGLPSYLLRATQLHSRSRRQVGFWNSLPFGCRAEQDRACHRSPWSKPRTSSEGLEAAIFGDTQRVSPYFLTNHKRLCRVSRERRERRRTPGWLHWTPSSRLLGRRGQYYCPSLSIVVFSYRNFRHSICLVHTSRRHLWLLSTRNLWKLRTRFGTSKPHYGT